LEPREFIDKWRDAELSESSGSQSHFNDLCRLLDLPTPAEADKTGKSFTFEKTVKKPGGGAGYADVWKKDCFAWEYKGDKKNLVAAYAQLKGYADALDNPPLLIVSDMREIRIHTNFTNAVAEVVSIDIADLNSVEARRKLYWAFTDPEKLRPTVTREGVTAKAAALLGALANKLQRQGLEQRRVAHFLNRLVFCMFAEDIELLPDRVFADVIEESNKHPDQFVGFLTDLFRAMRLKDGRFGKTLIPWFNGGLFDDDDVLPLGALDIRALAEIARLDWAAVEPAIFGTLFERGLDPEVRKAMASLFDAPLKDEEQKPLPFAKQDRLNRGVGIYYTDPDTIMRIVEPVVLRPWREEWAALKDEIKTLKKDKARNKYLAFRHRLGQFRVLDPACGSGNFLYLALIHLKDFDREVADEAEAMGLPADGERVKPEAMRGVEINPYAAELARVTLWIGELQWQMRKSLGITRRPILGRLDGIVCRDALVKDDVEAAWPDADVAIGNPPFLGGKLLRTKLGDEYIDRLFRVFDGKVPAEADLVCYWFTKAFGLVRQGRLRRVGLVATNSVRGGANRRVLDDIAVHGRIADAWSDEPWVLDGAAVRVSLVAFDCSGVGLPAFLNGKKVEKVFSDLTGDTDLTTTHALSENENIAFSGISKKGKFEIEGRLARE